jgi:hypothetical protein
MIITNCNCGEKVTCGCGTLSFDSYLASSVSVLSVGNLVSSGGCILEEYVIDWYKDGVYYLTSGLGFDADIDTFHPFEGESAVIVEAGIYVPILRYIVIGGDVIFIEPKPCQKWCDLIVDLPTITVTAIYCGLIGTGINAPFSNYDYRISYTSGTDWSQAGRALQFNLDINAIYFVYRYAPESVADRLTIWHSNDLINPIVDYIAGQNLTGTNYDVDPDEIDNRITQQVVLLPVFTTGAYLKIQIIPSVKETTQNTNWRLDMKCLDDTYDFCEEISYYDVACQAWDIDTLSFTYDSVGCFFILQMEFPCTVRNTLPSTSGVTRYAGLSGGQFNIFTGTTDYIYGGKWAYTTRVNTNSNFITNYSTQLNSYGSISVTKSGNTFTFICNNVNDYIDLKAGYNYVITQPLYTGFTNDNTNLAYYRNFEVDWRQTDSGGCGDSQTNSTYVFHLNSVFNWDDDNLTLILTASTASNGYATSSDACNLVYSDLDSIVNSINNLISSSDFTNRITYCRYKHPFGHIRGRTISIGLISAPIIRFFSMPLKYSIPCSIPSWGKFGGNSQWYWFNFYFNVTITATRDINGNWLKPPLENFTVTTNLGTNGLLMTSSVIIYKKVDNVVETKVAWADID